MSWLRNHVQVGVGSGGLSAPIRLVLRIGTAVGSVAPLPRVIVGHLTGRSGHTLFSFGRMLSILHITSTLDSTERARCAAPALLGRLPPRRSCSLTTRRVELRVMRGGQRLSRPAILLAIFGSHSRRQTTRRCSIRRCSTSGLRKRRRCIKSKYSVLACCTSPSPSRRGHIPVIMSTAKVTQSDR